MTLPSLRSTLAVIAAAIALVGCSPRRALTPAEIDAASKLDVVYARVQYEPTGGAKITLTVRNSLKQPVSGVRILYRILTSPDDSAIEMARAQSEVAVDIAPGDVTQVEIELPTQARNPGAGTFARAYAMRVGSDEMAPPPLWKP